MRVLLEANAIDGIKITNVSKYSMTGTFVLNEHDFYEFLKDLKPGDHTSCFVTLSLAKKIHKKYGLKRDDKKPKEQRK